MFDSKQLLFAYRKIIYSLVGIIFGCVMMTAVFYFLITSHPVHRHVSDLEVLRQVALIFGITALFASFVVKNMILRKTSNAGMPAEMDLNKSIKRLTSAAFVSFALCEAAVLFGLVVAYIGYNTKDLILPVLIGSIGFSLHFPRYQQWEQWIQD